jgi:hypothetical protein
VRVLLWCVMWIGCAPPEDGACVVRGSAQRRFVIDSFTLPKTRALFAVDLDGDKRADNQLGNIVSAAQVAGALSQMTVDEAIAAGSFKPEIVLTADEVVEAAGAGAVWSDGGMAGNFCGAIASGEYRSDDSGLVELTLKMPFFDYQLLPVTAARIRFAITGTRLIAGQLNGAVRKADFDRVALPGIAKRLNEKIAQDPADPANQQILKFLDGTGDATCDGTKNGFIEVCEVATNSVLRTFLDSDVDLFDGKGAYRPGADDKLDSVSMGVGFTATQLP